MAGILVEETAEMLLVATIYSHLSIQPLLQRSLVCIAPDSEPMETHQATFDYYGGVWYKRGRCQR